MTEPSISLEAAQDLMDKWDAEAAAAKKAATPPDKKRKKVKDAIKAGAKQGRGGLGIHTKRLLDQVDD
jgi:hypothetical protein